MSQPTTTGPAGPKGSAGRSAGAQARAERAAAARAERERKARAARMRNLAISIAVVVVLAVAAVIVIPRLHSSSSTPAATPAGLTTYRSVTGAAFGSATAPVTITLFEDFQCPVCLHLEQTTGAEFTNLANSGKTRVIYSMVSFLDDHSKNQYSSRSANAYYCAPQAQRNALHDYLYAHQPGENTAGPTDAQLIAEAKTAGITSTGYASCVTAHTYSSYATGHQTNVLGRTAGSVGTPTMEVNGKLYPGVLTLTPAILDQIVAQASSS